MSRRVGWTIAGAALLVAAAWAPFSCLSRPPVTPAQLETLPLTITAGSSGGSTTGVGSWQLTVNSKGQAELVILNIQEAAPKRFQVSNEQLAEFRKALAEHRFFELADEYGGRVVGGSTSSLTVTVGQHSKTVRVHFLPNLGHGDRGKLSEPARAVYLLNMIRGWFDDPQAVDRWKHAR